MKTKILFPFLCLFYILNTNGQSDFQAPTLSAGLDNVAFNKGTLDVELITKIIAEKQKEIVREGIKRIIFKTIGNSNLDDFSQFYIERITQIIFQEKNHKVMTKRILEESTNYLFVLGTTKLILDSKNNFLKELFNEDSEDNLSVNLNEIEDTDIRNKIIKTVLTICSEIPEIKELGLLNNFNYYEHFEIYDKQFIKVLINDYREIINIIKKPKDFFANATILKKVKDIQDLFDEKDKSSENIKIEIENKINTQIDELGTFISEKFKIQVDEKIIKKLISNKIFSEEKFIKYKVVIKAIKFIQNVLSKSSILKDVLNNSGLEFNKIGTSFEDIVRNYETSFDGYDSNDLIFNNINDSLVDNTLISKIDAFKKSIEKNSEEYKKIDLNQIRISQEDIENELSTFNQFRKKTDSIILALESLEAISLKYDITGFKKDISKYLGYTLNVPKIDKSKVDELVKQLHFTRNERFDDLKTQLKIKKTDLEIRNFSLINDVNYKEIIKLKDDTTSSSIVKELVSKVEIGASYIDKLNKSSLLETINGNYNNVTNLFKKIREFSDSNVYHKEKIDSIYDSFDANPLFQQFAIKKDFNLNSIQNLSNNLELLTGKLFVKGYSKTGDNSLFYMIKKYLVTKKITLKTDTALTNSELLTLKKVNSFFLDRNMNKRLKDLEFINFFNSEILAELLIISNKLDGSKNENLNMNKLLASIEFAISNKIITKTIESKDHLNIPHIDKLKDFLKFIGNIKELGKAETFAFLLKTMNDYEFLFSNANSETKLIPDLINSLREYAIIDLNNNSIEIDVASVLTHILEKYQKNRKFSFYATVGLNQFWTNTDLTDSDGKNYSNFNAASEKIGAKFKIWNFNERPFMEDDLYHKVKRKALVSDIYTMAYFSGILYKIANTSGRDYNSANFGLAFGLTFFNSLDFNFSYSIPMEGKVFQNSLMGISFEIPLSEYLKRL
jgi:hypothetical protein